LEKDGINVTQPLSLDPTTHPDNHPGEKQIKLLNMAEIPYPYIIMGYLLVFSDLPLLPILLASIV